MSQRTCTLDGCTRPHYSKGMCKPCYRRDYYQRNRDRELAAMAQWREENREYDRQRWADYSERRWGAERQARAEAQAARLAADDKMCTGCGETKSKSDFHRDPRRLDGLYSWCKSCFHRHVASVRTPETEAERRRMAYADPVKREKMLARHREWSRANPENGRKNAAVRRARELAATVGEVDYAAIIERDGMVCHLCRTGIEALDELHFDHVVPLARGGEHSMANIRPAHATCNLRKKDKLVSELDWLPVT